MVINICVQLERRRCKVKLKIKIKAELTENSRKEFIVTSRKIKEKCSIKSLLVSEGEIRNSLMPTETL